MSKSLAQYIEQYLNERSEFQRLSASGVATDYGVLVGLKGHDGLVKFLKSFGVARPVLKDFKAEWITAYLIVVRERRGTRDAKFAFDTLHDFGDWLEKNEYLGRSNPLRTVEISGGVA